MVKMLTVLVSTISNLQVLLLKKNVNATHIFSSKNICIYAIFHDQSFNDMLSNVMVSFKQLGPDWLLSNVSAENNASDAQGL